MLPETAKADLGKGRLAGISKCSAAIDTSDNTESLTRLQAARIMRRFPVSMPVALVTARLAYGVCAL